MTEVLATLLLAVTLPGSVELLALTLAGLLRPASFGPRRREIRRLAAVVPAHDEADGIAGCVEGLLRSDPSLEVVVVADNCTDDTAALAAEAGARVLERRDEHRRGKGYALDFAFQALLEEDVAAVLVVDADTVVATSFVPTMRRWLEAGEEAVQCRYGVLNPGDTLRTRLMSVALMAFNTLRPRGRDRLGLSAGLFGNGFALTADTLRAVPYDAESVVEDLEYHLRLVRAGRRVRFADDTEVRAVMPTGGKGVDTQRARWEGGRLRMLREQALPLLGDLLRGRVRLLEPLLDLALMPLASHVLVVGLALAVAPAGSRLLPALSLAVVGLHVAAGLRVGRAGRAEVRALLAVPGYIAWKLLRLPAALAASRGDSSWVRTEREPGKGPGDGR